MANDRRRFEGALHLAQSWLQLARETSTSHTCRGYLYAATRCLTKARSSSGVAFAPAFSATAAPTSSPSVSCGTPITAASATAGCS